MSYFLDESPEEIKRFRTGCPQSWFAVSRQVFGHEVVGAHVKAPAAADGDKQAWQPMVAWLWMLAEAAFQDRRVNIKGRILQLERGQFVCSERHLAKQANWKRKAAHGFLCRLAKCDMVFLSTATRDGQYLLDFAGQKKGPDITIVTIRNYNTYQFTAPQQGASQGPARGQIITRDTYTRESNQSTVGISKKEDLHFEHELGTDGIDLTSNVVQLHPKPEGRMVMDPPEAPGQPYAIPTKTREKIEALAVDPEDLLDRMYEQIDKGRRIGSKSRYLIQSALNEAHQRDGTPIETLKQIISGNKFAREQALVAASVGPPQVSEAELAWRARSSAPRSNGAALAAALKRGGNTARS